MRGLNTGFRATRTLVSVQGGDYADDCHRKTSIPVFCVLVTTNAKQVTRSVFSVNGTASCASYMPGKMPGKMYMVQESE